MTQEPLEQYRPAYHFTPPKMWMNDPNGMVYYDGEWHQFYQYYPDDTVWGPMHWGHAVSRDLVNWEHLPIALYPDENGLIFSGSAVIDWHNTSGFGEEAMVAIFTHHDQPRQSQSLAYSNDNGRTWTKYAGNPVIKPPSGMRNFRDPKVFWYGDDPSTGSGDGHWVMVIAAGSAALFYTSPDLINWESSGGFLRQGATCGVWETPDLFELPVDGSAETRWVLTIGVGDCAPAGGTGVQYFIGDFDGETFTNDNAADRVLWADFGADFYAPQSWSDAPDGRRVWLGWMNNWQYATTIPTSTWRGALTIPREVGLTRTPDGIRLTQSPAPDLQLLRGQPHVMEQIALSGEMPLDISGGTLEIVAEFAITPQSDRFGIRVHVGDAQSTTVGYGTKQKVLFVDRGESGDVAFNDTFTTAHTAPLALQDGKLRLHIFVDHSSIEIFAENGTLVMTERVFPDANGDGVVLFGDVLVEKLTVWALERARYNR